MVINNPYQQSIEKLDDADVVSNYGASAVQVLRTYMVYDSGHDESHIVRVLRNALWFGQGGDKDVIVPAAILHDLVNIPKDNPDRSRASYLSARKAVKELEKHIGFKDFFHKESIFHAIEAHSWSAKIAPRSLEAKAVQDADRIDSLGLIGIARLFATGGAMSRILFHPTDPTAQHRSLDEMKYTLDHFFVKLQKLHLTMQTNQGQIQAQRLTLKMQDFISNLVYEL